MKEFPAGAARGRAASEPQEKGLLRPPPGSVILTYILCLSVVCGLRIWEGWLGTLEGGHREAT